MLGQVILSSMVSSTLTMIAVKSETEMSLLTFKAMSNQFHCIEYHVIRDQQRGRPPKPHTIAEQLSLNNMAAHGPNMSSKLAFLHQKSFGVRVKDISDTYGAPP